MSKRLSQGTGHYQLVHSAIVACFAAILVNRGCEAQFLVDNGGGIGVIPPGLRLSQTLQQGGLGFPRPGLFRTFEAPSPPTVLDAAATDPLTAEPDTSTATTAQELVPPPPPPPKALPPPPSASNSTTRWRRSSLPNSISSAPAPAPAQAYANSTSVSFSELIAWAAVAPAPHGFAPNLAPAPQPAANATSAPAQPTQMTNLPAAAPAGAAPPAAAVPRGPPGGGTADPRAQPLNGRSEPETCEAQGLTGQCNQCVCCCVPAGSGGFWRFVPSDGCSCSKVVSKSDIWIALALVGVVLLPAAAWALYFSKALCISPYKPRAPAAVHPAAQNGH
ncbi:hypothetical protein WJX75_001923 [Coccomyxa subellipsoidea]|uniref:Uncharacterized protein n=1 Tax=Coccomyxa subellipsoidea TaxID=248742 RepID=A0ABR2YCT1_9CHLO